MDPNIEYLARRIEQQQQAQQVQPTYFLLAVEEDTEVKEFTNKQDMLSYLRDLRESEMLAPFNLKVKMFCGSRIHLSKGDYKFVLFPDGTKVPLLAPDLDKLEPDEEGTLIERRKPEQPLDPDPEEPEEGEGQEGEGDFEEFDQP